MADPWFDSTAATLLLLSGGAPAEVPWFEGSYPSKAVRRTDAQRSASYQAWAGPVDRPFNPTTEQGAIPFVQPQRPHYGRRRAHLDPSFFWSPLIIANPAVTPIGSDGTVLCVEPSELVVSYSWQSPTQKTLSGREQRMGTMRMPRETYHMTKVLSDAQARYIQGKLNGEGADAATWLLAMWHLAITVSADATATTIPVSSTALALADWARVGQRVAVLGLDGETFLTSYLTSVGGGQVGVQDDLTSVAVKGAVLVPLNAVMLDPTQVFGRAIAGASRWELVAHARGFWPNMGTGATVNTYDGLPVWDYGVGVQDLAAQPVHLGSTLIDYGIKRRDISTWENPDGERAFRFSNHRATLQQWLRAFLYAARGRQNPFLLPSGRPDLLPAGDASSGTLLVEAAPVALAPDYVNNWFASEAHRRIMLVLSTGAVHYRSVASCLNNGDGTQSLTLDSALAGTIDHIQLLETCRLESDVVEVSYQGITASADLVARVVQE